MNADTAREILATVERLNTENRELLNARDNQNQRIETLNNAVTELDGNLTEARNEAHRLRSAPITNADDPRLEELWAKAYRYAQSAGFCSEFERIADELGIPQQSLTWTGTAIVSVSVSVPVYVSGVASRADINDGTVDDYEVDGYAVAEALNEYSFDAYNIGHYEVDEVEDVCADDE